jgi:hypothetical protein
MYHEDGVYYFAELKALDNNTFKGFYSLKYSNLDEIKKEQSSYKKPMSLRFISALR